MRLARPATVRRRVTLVPLIDVLFILLVYFMVTSVYRDLDMIPVVRGGDPMAGAAQVDGGAVAGADPADGCGAALGADAGHGRLSGGGGRRCAAGAAGGRRMRLRRADHRPPAEPIIALVDVVFFLLVFFLLVARFDASAPFEVVPPIAVSGQDMPGGGVTLSVARDGALAVNGDAVGDDWLAQIEAAAARDAARLIRINAHRDVAMRHLMPLVSALEAAALGEVVIVVTPSGP